MFWLGQTPQPRLEFHQEVGTAQTGVGHRPPQDHMSRKILAVVFDCGCCRCAMNAHRVLNCWWLLDFGLDTPDRSPVPDRAVAWPVHKKTPNDM